VDGTDFNGSRDCLYRPRRRIHFVVQEAELICDHAACCAAANGGRPSRLPSARLMAAVGVFPNMNDTKSMTDVPPVECDQYHACLAVSDVSTAVEFYMAKLGFLPAFTEGVPPTFAGVNLGRAQIFLERGTPSPEGCSVYFVVNDADELHRFHRSKGVEVTQPIDDRSYGLRDYTIRDPHGYRLRFGHRLLSAGPPLPIERVDVPVRLEKRLAALLIDLAEHKRMSLNSCLEEIDPVAYVRTARRRRGQPTYQTNTPLHSATEREAWYRE